MTKLLLIRHGESQANRNKIFAGHYDTDLQDTGIVQAELTAQYIAENFNIDKVYTSDLKRAFKTGKALADRTNTQLIATAELREINAGKWEGMVFDEIPKVYTQDFDMWYTDIGNARCTDGESVAELGERIMSTLTKIACENEGKTIGIATHATPIRVMQTLVQTGDLNDMANVPWVSNASVSVFNYDNGNWSVERVSIDEHLGNIRTAPPKEV